MLQSITSGPRLSDSANEMRASRFCATNGLAEGSGQILIAEALTVTSRFLRAVSYAARRPGLIFKSTYYQ